MIEHDGYEHVLPNGDILIVHSTIKDPVVEEAFAALRAELRVKAAEAYARLQYQPHGNGRSCRRRRTAG